MAREFPDNIPDIETRKDVKKMEKCKYCNRLPNGDYLDEYDDLIYERNEVSLRDRHQQNEYFSLKTEVDFNLTSNVFVDGNNGSLNLSLFYTDGFDEIADVSVNINYCPMCGRKFSHA